MERRQAALGSVIFFLAAPVVVAGVVPWWLATTRSAWSLPDQPWLQALGVALVVVATPALVWCFVDFVRARGTPAPVAPTQRLVVEGLYRHVRNPMYVAVVTIILGQALWHSSGAVLVYGIGAWAVMASFVRFWEEPTLRRQFGADYDRYRRAVPAWLPRPIAWNPDA